MKQAEIEVGARVLVRVSGDLRECRVIGTGQIRVGRWDTHKFVTGYRVADVATGRELPKLRRGVSLRPCPTDRERWLQSREPGL